MSKSMLHIRPADLRVTTEDGREVVWEFDSDLGGVIKQGAGGTRAVAGVPATTGRPA